MFIDKNPAYYSMKFQDIIILLSPLIKLILLLGEKYKTANLNRKILKSKMLKYYIFILKRI